MLSDEERARHILANEVPEVWDRVCHISDETFRGICKRFAVEFAALREECAKVAENPAMSSLTEYKVEGPLADIAGIVGRDIAKAIRTAQPAAIVSDKTSEQNKFALKVARDI